jgi:hypothetical protein
MEHHFLAYIDAGTGSMILQGAIAAIVAVPFILRTQIGRVVHALRSRFGSRGAGADDVAGTH